MKPVITVITKAYHWSLFCTKSIQFKSLSTYHAFLHLQMELRSDTQYTCRRWWVRT